jgi:hypothetical protein
LAQNVVSIISGDKAKTQIYCQILDLSDELDQANQQKDRDEALSQKINELQKNLAPNTWRCSRPLSTWIQIPKTVRRSCRTSLSSIIPAGNGDVLIRRLTSLGTFRRSSRMGFNRRKLEDQRRQVAEKEAAAQRATDAQVLEDAERLIAAWNERQAIRAPMVFSPTIGAAIRTRYWFLWVRCPACRTIYAIDLRTLDRHHDAAVTSLIPSLSCRSCRSYAPFAELVRLSRTSIVDEMREEYRRRVLGE